MAKEFDIRRYKNLQELYFDASMELRNTDLLFIRKFGRTANLSADTTEDIWAAGGSRVIQTAAQTLNISSASANDTLSGTGAWYVQIQGVDGNYDLVTETITLDGTTTVTSTNQFLEINRARTVFHGSSRYNEGAITITGATTADTLAQIPAQEAIDKLSHFTIPRGYTCFTVGVGFTVYRSSGSGTRRAEVDQMVYVPAANAVYRTLRYGVSSDGGAYQAENQVLSQTPEKCTLWFQATAEANNTLATSSAAYILVREDLNYRTEI